MLDTGLKGQNALITGGGTGIGLGIAQALAREGVNVAIASRNPSPAAIAALGECGATVVAIPTDVSAEDQVVAMVDTTIRKLGRVDLFVNNAAAHWDESATRLTTTGWFNSINTNLSACVWACREVGRHMIDAGSGSILIVGSTAAHNPLPAETSYRVSKSGLKAYMEVLAVELAPFKIRVNLLTPGAVRSRMHESLDPRLLADGARRDIPLRRIAEARELGATALLLLSDRLSPYTTGAEFVIDGGFRLRPVPVHSDEELRALNTS